MNNAIRSYLLLILLFGFTFSSNAQQEEIDTDRPDQTETPSIVPRNRFQMENGFLHKYDAQEDGHEMELPTSLWKFGISEMLELRIITTVAHNVYQDSTLTGLEPVIVGVKLKLWDEQGALPKASVIGQVLLPDVASREMKLEHVAPEIRLLLQNTITDAIDLGYNAGIFWDGESSKANYAYTFSPSIDIVKSVKAYVETYGFLKTSRHPEHWIDGGFMLLITKDIQLDVSAGYELTSPSGRKHSTFESIGFSFRI